jgi:hypothetical protein
MEKHICKRIDYCICSILADEPNEDCYIHGHGKFPLRCQCGKFVKWEKFDLRRAEPNEPTCDDCVYQEGRHYCLLHTRTVKNMDIMRCGDFTYIEDDHK